MLEKYKILSLGAEGGCIEIHRTYLNNVSLFTVSCSEIFEESVFYSNIYLTVEDAWLGLRSKFPIWHQLYLDYICTQMFEVVRKDYLAVPNKDAFTMVRWLEQLNGLGLGY